MKRLTCRGVVPVIFLAIAMAGCATPGKDGTVAGKAARGDEYHPVELTFVNSRSDNLFFRRTGVACMAYSGSYDFPVSAGGSSSENVVEDDGGMCEASRKSETWSVSPIGGNISYVHFPTTTAGVWAVQVPDNTGNVKGATCTVDGSDQNCLNTYAKGMDLQKIRIVF
jgi:hypothetical protein